MKRLILYLSPDYQQVEYLEETLHQRFGRSRVKTTIDYWVVDNVNSKDPQKKETNPNTVAEKEENSAINPDVAAKDKKTGEVLPFDIVKYVDCVIFIVGPSWNELNDVKLWNLKAPLKVQLDSIKLKLERARQEQKPLVTVFKDIDNDAVIEALHEAGLGWLNNHTSYDLSRPQMAAAFMSVLANTKERERKKENITSQKESPSSDVGILEKGLKQFTTDLFSPLKTSKDSLDPIEKDFKANLAKTGVGTLFGLFFAKNGVDNGLMSGLDKYNLIFSSLIFLIPLLLCFVIFYVRFTLKEKTFPEVTFGSYTFYLLPELIKFGLAWELMIYATSKLGATDYSVFIMGLAMLAILTVYFTFLFGNLKAFIIIITSFYYKTRTLFFYTALSWLIGLTLIPYSLCSDPRTKDTMAELCISDYKNLVWFTMALTLLTLLLYYTIEWSWEKYKENVAARLKEKKDEERKKKKEKEEVEERNKKAAELSAKFNKG